MDEMLKVSLVIFGGVILILLSISYLLQMMG